MTDAPQPALRQNPMPTAEKRKIRKFINLLNLLFPSIFFMFFILPKVYKSPEEKLIKAFGRGDVEAAEASNSFTVSLLLSCISFYMNSAQDKLVGFRK